MAEWTHMLVECMDCDKAALSDKELITEFLNDLPSKIGMQKLSEPVVYDVTEDVHEDPGVTGIVVIVTSHISIHTFPEGQVSEGIDSSFMVFDCFSCRNFDTDLVAREISKTFKPKSLKQEKIKRMTQVPSLSTTK